MDYETANLNTAKYPLGPLLSEGKTKQIYEVKGNPHLVLVVSKDDITAGDGAKHDILPSKGEWSTETTCNVFEVLRAAGTQIAYVERDNVNSFVAQLCEMLPYEVVVRREAHGSYLKRYPEVVKGERFPEVLVEFFLKTKNREWKDYSLQCDDPLTVFSDDHEVLELYNPSVPFKGQKPFLTLNCSEVFTYEWEWEYLEEMRFSAMMAFRALETVWHQHGGRLVDFKVEYGIDTDGKLLLADVIDNDSWRVIMGDGYIDKQIYRDGGELDEVSAKYKQVAEITSRFRS